MLLNIPDIPMVSSALVDETIDSPINFLHAFATVDDGIDDHAVVTVETVSNGFHCFKKVFIASGAVASDKTKFLKNRLL